MRAAYWAVVGVLWGLAIAWSSSSSAQVLPQAACQPSQPCNSASVRTGSVATPFVDAGVLKAGLVDAGVLLAKEARMDLVDAGRVNVQGNASVNGRLDVGGQASIGGVGFLQNGIIQCNPCSVLSNSQNANDTGAGFAILSPSGQGQDAGYYFVWGMGGGSLAGRLGGIYWNGEVHTRGVDAGSGTFTGPVRVVPGTLPTCGDGTGGTVKEGSVVSVAGASAVPSKFCVCRFTPTGAIYAWDNLLTTTGNALRSTTVCSD